jgi:hypothetical protein
MRPQGQHPSHIKEMSRAEVADSIRAEEVRTLVAKHRPAVRASEDTRDPRRA